MNEAGFYNTSAKAGRLPVRLLFLICLLALPSHAGLVFNEVMIGSYQSGEWIELFNPDSGAFGLSGIRLYEGNDTILLDPSGKIMVPGRGYILIAQDSAKLVSGYPFIGCRIIDPSSWLVLNNDGDTLSLCDSTGKILDRLGYDVQTWFDQPIPDGVSLERRSYAASSDEIANWALCRNPNGATPGFTNSVLPAAGKSLQLRAGPKLFRPESGEQIHITMELPGAGELVLEIFSFDGRSVHVIRTGPAADKLELSWGGRHNGLLLKPGPYVLLAEWKTGGRKETRKQSVVIAPAK